MSNGSSSGDSALSTLGTDQYTVLSHISTILNALGDIDPDPDSAAVLKIASDVAQLGALFSPDPVQSEIGALAQKIQDVYVQLGAVDAAGQIQTRKTFLDQTVADASSAQSDLPNAIQNPTVYSPGSLILQCQTVLNNFAIQDNLIWNITYLVADYEKIYWSDLGQYQSTCYYLRVSGGFDANPDDAVYGLLSPPLNADGVTVFEYRLTLPLYLWAITVFLGVGLALDPQFLTNREADLVQARDTLSWVYDKIMTPGSGLTPLCPPDWTASSLLETACPSPVAGTPPPRPALRLIYSAGKAPPPVAGVLIEYGAVERFSGNSSIGDKYQLNFQSSTDSQNTALFNKLQVRTLKRTRDVYVNSGLLTVWQAINQLNALVGDPPLSSSTFLWQDGSPVDLVRWSFRQVFRLAKVARSANGYSLRALGNFLIGTQPFDTPYSPGATSFSFLDLMTKFND